MFGCLQYVYCTGMWYVLHCTVVTVTWERETYNILRQSDRFTKGLFTPLVNVNQSVSDTREIENETQSLKVIQQILSTPTIIMMAITYIPFILFISSSLLAYSHTYRSMILIIFVSS
jgi:hypothetical protein